jgi:hypothetical protein
LTSPPETIPSCYRRSRHTHFQPRSRRHPETIRQILSPIVKASRDKTDFYNRTRAAIKLAELSLAAGEKLSESELLYLIGAYHFLFNERLPGLFDQCHDALWKTFEMSGDITNLLILFRHSSLYWRLRGRDARERRYLQQLGKIVGTRITEKLSSLNREAAYYLVRASAETPSPNMKSE